LIATSWKEKMRHTFNLLLSLALLSALSLAQDSAPRNKEVPPVPNIKNLDHPAFRIFNPDTLAKPLGGYSQVAEVTGGKTVFIAGQVALDRSGNLVGKDDFQAQATQVFENLKAAIQASGGDFHSIIKLNIYCAESVDPLQTAVFREVRDRYVDTVNPPTSTFVVVKRLVRPELLLEVDAVAVVPK
jgi:enamine deaminase RidA (YjgF/YER057c/UK114 family)